MVMLDEGQAMPSTFSMSSHSHNASQVTLMSCASPNGMTSNMPKYQWDINDSTLPTVSLLSS